MNFLFLCRLSTLIIHATCFAAEHLNLEDCGIKQEKNFYINLSHQQILSESVKTSEYQNEIENISHHLNSIALGYATYNSRFEYELIYFSENLIENVRASEVQHELQLYNYVGMINFYYHMNTKSFALYSALGGGFGMFEDKEKEGFLPILAYQGKIGISYTLTQNTKAFFGYSNFNTVSLIPTICKSKNSIEIGMSYNF